VNRKTRLHVIEGKSATPRLCGTCWSGVVMRSARSEEDEVFCQYVNRPVSNDIVSCDRYAERDSGNSPSAQTHESAWVA